MRKSIAALLMPCVLACLPVQAHEMFESYPKQFALGYVEDQVNLRYWFNPTWALDMTGRLSDTRSTSKFDDGVVIARDTADSNGYTVGFAAVRALKSFTYLDLNLKAGFSYSSGTTKSNPEGPNNAATQRTRSQSVFIGPEVEIKVP